MIGVALMVIGLAVLIFGSALAWFLASSIASTLVVAIIGAAVFLIGVYLFVEARREGQSQDYYEDAYMRRGYTPGYYERSDGAYAGSGSWGGLRFEDLRPIPWTVGGSFEGPGSRRDTGAPPSVKEKVPEIAERKSDEVKSGSKKRSIYGSKIYNTGRCPACGRAVGVTWMACPTCHHRFSSF